MNKSNCKYSIVIPAFNEEQGIGRVLESLKELSNEGVEILVVSDGSTDKTSEVVKSFPYVKLIEHRMNKGYGASLKTGIQKASGEFVVFCDADGQHQISDIKKVLYGSEDFDMVVGARSKESHVQRERVVGKKIISLVGNYLVGEKIPDINSGLRSIRREIILKYLHLLPSSFSASTTSTMVMLKRGYLVRWMPITTVKREGKSTVKQFRHGFYTLHLILRIVTLFNPLKVFVPVSLVLFVFGILWGIAYLPGNLSIFAGTLMLASVIIFMFGILCDQVSQQRLEKYE